MVTLTFRNVRSHTICISFSIITSRLGSCGKVMFSVIFVCLSFCLQREVPIVEEPGPAPPRMGPHPALCTGLCPSPDIKLVHYEARTVSKWAVGILLECFLVISFFRLCKKFVTFCDWNWEGWIYEVKFADNDSQKALIEFFWSLQWHLNKPSNLLVLRYSSIEFTWDSLGAMHSSFPIIHKVGNIGIFVLLKFDRNIAREISHFNYNLEHFDNCKCSLKMIMLLTVYNVFPFNDKVAQKSQNCQLCVLRENSVYCSLSTLWH